MPQMLFILPITIITTTTTDLGIATAITITIDLEVQMSTSFALTTILPRTQEFTSTVYAQRLYDTSTSLGNGNQ
jgi:hypothetical protein